MNSEHMLSGINPVAVTLQRNGGLDSGGRVSLIQLNAVDPEGHGVVIKNQIRDGDRALAAEIPCRRVAVPAGCNIYVLEFDVPLDSVRFDVIELETDFSRTVCFQVHGERIFSGFRQCDFRKRELALHTGLRHDELQTVLSVRGSRGINFSLIAFPVFRTGFFVIVDGSDSSQSEFETGILNRICPHRQQRQKSEGEDFSVHFIFPFITVGLAIRPLW